MSTLSERTSGPARLRPVRIDGTSALKLRPGEPGQYSSARRGIASLYDEDYYERGVEKGISGYSNYRWIPELTIPMAMTIVDVLGIRAQERVLDFGCAKGFTVKALRMLRRDAEGIDISEYAIGQAPHDVAPFCHVVNDLESWAATNRYGVALAKDVLEHIPYEQIDDTLDSITSMAGTFFAVVPLGHVGPRGVKRFVIDAYERDVTHIVRESADWWRRRLERHWRSVTWRHHIDGIKDNWHRVDPLGNGAFIARGSRAR